jgi:hypothetical protein
VFKVCIIPFNSTFEFPVDGKNNQRKKVEESNGMNITVEFVYCRFSEMCQKRGEKLISTGEPQGANIS